MAFRIRTLTVHIRASKRCPLNSDEILLPWTAHVSSLSFFSYFVSLLPSWLPFSPPPLPGPTFDTRRISPLTRWWWWWWWWWWWLHNPDLNGPSPQWRKRGARKRHVGGKGQNMDLKIEEWLWSAVIFGRGKSPRGKSILSWEGCPWKEFELIQPTGGNVDALTNNLSTI